MGLSDHGTTYVRVGGDDGQLRPWHFLMVGGDDEELRPWHFLYEGRRGWWGPPTMALPISG